MKRVPVNNIILESVQYIGSILDYKNNIERYTLFSAFPCKSL